MWRFIMGNKTQLHVHDDIEILQTVSDRLGNKFFPNRWVECYIMQENKIVFTGTCKMAEKFIGANEGRLLNAI